MNPHIGEKQIRPQSYTPRDSLATAWQTLVAWEKFAFFNWSWAFGGGDLHIKKFNYQWKTGCSFTCILNTLIWAKLQTMKVLKIELNNSLQQMAQKIVVNLSISGGPWVVGFSSHLVIKLCLQAIVHTQSCSHAMEI